MPISVHTCCSVPGMRTGASFYHAMTRTGKFLWFPCCGLGNYLPRTGHHLPRTGASPAADWAIPCRGLRHHLPWTGASPAADWASYLTTNVT